MLNVPPHWDGLLGRELISGLKRDQARRKADGEFDVPSFGGVGGLYVLVGWLAGSAGLILARMINESLLGDGQDIFVAGVVAGSTALLMFALERARSRSRSIINRVAGMPMSFVLLGIWCVDIAFALWWLLKYPDNTESVRGRIGLALLVVAVAGAWLLFVLASRARPILAAEVYADARAARDLERLAEMHYEKTLNQTNAETRIREIRARWQKDRTEGKPGRI
ncbi:MAG: hypothetical protein ACRCTR_07830 [Actinomycetota bacterium]